MKTTIFVLAIFFAAGVSLAAQEGGVNPAFDYSDARLFNNSGVDFISSGKYKEAVKEFQRALAVDPDFHAAKYNLALAYYNMGNVKEAIAEFEYLINSSYYFVNARYNLGTIYLKEAMLDKAQEQLKIVTELEPGYAEAYFNLGFIYFKKGLLDDAIAEYQKGLRIKPETLNGRLSLALLYEKKGMDKEAIEEYRKAAGLRPDKSDNIRQAIRMLEAASQIKQTLKAAPGDAKAYVHLGHMFYAREMYREAADSYNQALFYDPENNAAKMSVQKALVRSFAQKQ